MPTPSEDYQASLNDLLLGAGTDYHFGQQGISGLGGPPSKTATFDLDGQDGKQAGPEFMDERQILLHIEIVKATDTDGWNALKALKEAWFPSVDDLDLFIQLPGWGPIYYTGRPRSVEADVTNAYRGHITVICEFMATDPHANDVIS